MTADQHSGPVFRQPGTVLTDHVFMVPLDHERPDGEQIEVFAREVAPAAGVTAIPPCRGSSTSRVAPGSAARARSAASHG